MSEEKIKQRMAKIKQDRVLFFTNSLTQYAITKKAVFRDALGQKSWSKTRRRWNKLKKEGKEKLVDLYTFYSTVGGNVTMESTERAIRSISFVIALNRAQASGLMRQDIPWYKFTDTKDINDLYTTVPVSDEMKHVKYAGPGEATNKYNPSPASLVSKSPSDTYSFSSATCNPFG